MDLQEKARMELDNFIFKIESLEDGYYARGMVAMAKLAGLIDDHQRVDYSHKIDQRLYEVG